MFRILSKHVRYHPVSILKNAYTTEAYHFPKEINSLKVMGTIQGDVERRTNGAMELFLKTLISSERYCIHRVIIANPTLSNMWRDQLEDNQRIYVNGKLQTENVYIEDKRYQNVSILATSLNRLDKHDLVSDIIPEDQMHRFDQNSIEMLAFIGAEVQNFVTCSGFSIRTHFSSQKGKPNELTLSDYHKVIVPNDSHMLQTSRNLRKGDRVYLKGHIDYSTTPHPDGKDYVSGHIIPKQLVKLTKFNT
ncbi:uncharacterized protein LOC116344717 [Contarinia nasturtii]|uniref:uncharacterized protein LOC116344717 n=1 Tax=Contarinia nasturtii TaxID=265458 RepID=UPI0012D46489|nr:uncharacterized protein LOC116344717 [Contarinia nasturtii]